VQAAIRAAWERLVREEAAVKEKQSTRRSIVRPKRTKI